jgi:hypothetical protein
MRVILFVIGHPAPLKDLNQTRGHLLLNQDDEVAIFPENLPRPKDDAVLAVISEETDDAWKTTLEMAEEAQRLIDEAGIHYDPYSHKVSLADKYITILNGSSYKWMKINRGGWTTIGSAASDNQKLFLQNSYIKQFFTTHAKEKDELTRVIIRAIQLHTKSRSSTDHFTSFVLMYIALDAALAGDTADTSKGKKMFNARAAALVNPTEHEKLLSKIKLWLSARHDIIHRAGGGKNCLEVDSVYEPLTEDLRILLKAALEHLCKCRLQGVSTLLEAWSQVPDPQAYVSLKSADNVMAVATLTTPASAILRRSNSWMVESIIAYVSKKS